MTFFRSRLHQIHSGPESCSVKTGDVSDQQRTNRGKVLGTSVHDHNEEEEVYYTRHTKQAGGTLM